jgi:hypothetical protein
MSPDFRTLPSRIHATISSRPIERASTACETFIYRFTPPDAGAFWYHPHLNEIEQLEKGLYGALIVRAADELALDAVSTLLSTASATITTSP